MIILLCSLLIVFLAFWAISEFKKFGIGLTFMTIIWSIVIYGFTPIFLNLSYNQVVNIRFTDNYFIASPFPMFAVIVFFISMFLGALFCRGSKFKIILENNLTQSYKISFWLLIIGVFSLLIFISGYGGLDYVLQNMSGIRSGTNDNKNYLASFLQSFAKYINLSFFILLVLFFRKQIYQKKIYFLFFFSVFLIGFNVYLSAGREAGIAILISFICIYISVFKKIPILTTTLLFFIGIFYILFGKTLLFALNKEDFDIDYFYSNYFYSTLGSSFELVFREFSHQYMSLVHFMQGDYGFRFMGDYMYWLFKPFKLLGFDIPDSISYYNTYLITGIWDSEIPPGAVAFGYIQLGILGVIFHGFLLGMFFQFFDRLFDPKNQLNSILLGFYALTVASFTYILSNSDPALFLQNRIPNILFFIIIVFFLGARIVRR